jgi:hypothetical protein
MTDQERLELQQQANNLKTWYTVYFVCVVAGIPLTIVIIGIFGILASVVFFCLILYRLWALIPKDEAETTPGQAVGFLFIPLFWLYWQFVAFLGLSKALNIQRSRLTTCEPPEVNEGFALTTCILGCVMVVPYLNLLVFIPYAVFSILVLQQMKNVGIAIIEDKLAKE